MQYHREDQDSAIASQRPSSTSTRKNNRQNKQHVAMIFWCSGGAKRIHQTERCKPNDRRQVWAKAYPTYLGEAVYVQKYSAGLSIEHTIGRRASIAKAITRSPTSSRATVLKNCGELSYSGCGIQYYCYGGTDKDFRK